MAERYGVVDGPGVRGVPLMQVAAADADAADGQENLVLADLRHRLLPQLDLERRTLVVHQCAHYSRLFFNCVRFSNPAADCDRHVQTVPVFALRWFTPPVLRT